MGAIRKPRCQTGCLNAAECRDARERRSDGDVEKAMDGFFNNLLVLPGGSIPGQAAAPERIFAYTLASAPLTN